MTFSPPQALPLNIKGQTWDQQTLDLRTWNHRTVRGGLGAQGALRPCAVFHFAELKTCALDAGKDPCQVMQSLKFRKNRRFVFQRSEGSPNPVGVILQPFQQRTFPILRPIKARNRC